MPQGRTQRNRLKRVLSAGFPFPFDVEPFLDRAIREFPQDPASYAYSLIIKSKAFRKRFPGIFRNDGTLRVTPAAYIQQEDQYRSAAAQFGIGLNRRQIGGLISTGKDPQEAAQLFKGIQLARQNPGLRDFLNQQIDAVNNRRAKLSGGDKYDRIPQIRSQKDLINFFAKRGERQVYALYEGALFQQQARSAGLDLSTGRARQLAAGTVGIDEESEEKFANIAAQLRQAGPELKSFKVNQRDLEILEFGGPGRAQIADRAQRALQQREAEQATRLVQQTLTTRTGRPTLSRPPQEAGL